LTKKIPLGQKKDSVVFSNNLFIDVSLFLNRLLNLLSKQIQLLCSVFILTIPVPVFQIIANW